MSINTYRVLCYAIDALEKLRRKGETVTRKGKMKEM
jgi:hypothetical protein